MGLGQRGHYCLCPRCLKAGLWGRRDVCGPSPAFFTQLRLSALFIALFLCLSAGLTASVYSNSTSPLPLPPVSQSVCPPPTPPPGLSVSLSAGLTTSVYTDSTILLPPPSLSLYPPPHLSVSMPPPLSLCMTPPLPA